MQCSGVCKWFNSNKGFGFITLEGGEDVFVHQSEIHAKGFRSLAEGEAVSCNVISDNYGKKKAVKVTGPGGAHVQGDSNGRGGGEDRYGNNGGSYGSNGREGRYGGGGGDRYGGGGDRYGGGGGEGRYGGGDRYGAGGGGGSYGGNYGGGGY